MTNGRLDHPGVRGTEAGVWARKAQRAALTPNVSGNVLEDIAAPAALDDQEHLVSGTPDAKRPARRMPVAARERREAIELEVACAEPGEAVARAVRPILAPVEVHEPVGKVELEERPVPGQAARHERLRPSSCAANAREVAGAILGNQLDPVGPRSVKRCFPSARAIALWSLVRIRSDLATMSPRRTACAR